MDAYSDPFKEAREGAGVMRCPFHGEEVTLILRHDEVRAAARDWERLSSDAPFRVPIPSEEEVRTVRQLPIETDPPDHGEYRALVEPFFQRAKLPEVIKQVEELIGGMLDEVIGGEAVEVVHDWALPIQSRALTYLLNVPEAEAETWIGWGIHVFKVTNGAFKKGTVLDEYLSRKFDEAEGKGQGDFFGALVNAKFRGRNLTRDECMGFANLAFAGGRDTIIHTISCVLGYLADHPQALEFLREDPKRITLASEEFFRVFMPLTLIGRVCRADEMIHGVEVPAGERVGLTWAAANFDETVFSEAEKVNLERKPNPHVSFGFGNHLCLGAAHARLILRTLLRSCAERVERLEKLDQELRVEHEAGYERVLGYQRLTLRFVGRVATS